MNIANTLRFYYIVGYEKLVGDTATVYSRLRSNQIPNIVDGFDDGQTHNLFVNSGINNPEKNDSVPYAGAPTDIKAASQPSVTTVPLSCKFQCPQKKKP
jgi:hypothetical protein